jgi:putative SOS response-associated peptidase YedK
MKLRRNRPGISSCDRLHCNALCEQVKSCTLIVSEPNELTAKIHDPMPVLLQPEDFDLWLMALSASNYLSLLPTTIYKSGQCRSE